MHILIALLMSFLVWRWLLANFVKLNNVVPGAYYTRQFAGVPVNGTDAVQTLTVTATGGDAKLSFDGFRTTALVFNASAGAIQTALRALPNIGATGVTITGTGPFVITFGGTLGRKAVPLITVVDSTLTGGTWTIANTTPGVDATQRRAPRGTQLNDTTNGIAYINTGTPPAQAWTRVGTQT